MHEWKVPKVQNHGAKAAPRESGRSIALDIFRGMAVAVMLLVDAVPDPVAVYPILAHSPWQGMTFADTAFPGFVFAMGASAAFSLERNGYKMRPEKLLRRVALLFLFGILFNALPYLLAWLVQPGYDAGRFYDEAVAHGRWFGVLQRLALSYAFGMALALWLKNGRKILLAAFFLLFLSSFGYHVYTPEAPFDKMDNISQAVDLIFPGADHAYSFYGLPFDPEGLYGTAASTASMLLGLAAGKVFSGQATVGQKAAGLALGGMLLLAGGGIWSLADMIGKPLWTSPYALLNAGGDMAVLAVLVLLADGRPGLAQCFRPFFAFGRNPLFFYLATNAGLVLLWTLPSPVEGMPVYFWLWENTLRGLGGAAFSAALYAALWCALWWPLAEWMHRRHIVIKI